MRSEIVSFKMSEVDGLGTREKIIALFEENRGRFFSGEDIASELAVSRAAVWKVVKSLRQEGYPITAVPNRGYCLSEEADIISMQGVQKYLQPVCGCVRMEIQPVLASTNTLARERAAEGVCEGYTVIANGQTAGRGRSGRGFYSPFDTGLYMSLVLRPHHYSAAQAPGLTTMAAVAVCEAIEIVSGKNAQIKWVNDIYVDGKKVSGILTEASVGLENGILEYAVLGVGINVSEPAGGFPKELEQIAGAVFQNRPGDGKNRLAAEFLNRFMFFYNSRERGWVESYRKRSLVIGKKIEVICGGQSREALALDVDGECHLMVRYEDGTTESLSSGEIRVKLA